MGIVGDKPEHGVRIELARARDNARAPWRYEGRAATPERDHPCAATIDGAGEVQVELDGDPASDPTLAALAEKIRLILRTVYKQAQSEGGSDEERAPPQRIVRWRGDK